MRNIGNERKINALRNIIWGTFFRLSNIIFPFIARTVFIHTLGSEYLGLNSLFISIIRVLSLAELGFGSALVFSMYKPIAKGDNFLVCALINFYRKVYRIIGALILLIGLIILPFLEYLIEGSYPSDINIYLVYLITLSGTVFSYFLYAYKASLFVAHQRNDIVNRISSVIVFFRCALQVILLLTTKNYYLYAIVVPLMNISENFLRALITKKMYPQIYCKGSIGNDLLTKVKKKIIGLISFKIYGTVFSSTDTIIISTFLGLNLLASYSNYTYIITSVVGFVRILSSSLVAGIGNSIVLESREKNYNDFKKLVFINGWIVSWCFVCLFCLLQPFIILWIGDSFLLPRSTMLLLSLYFLIPQITTITKVYKEAAGLWWEDRIRPLVATIFNISFSLLFVQKYGVDGVIIATLLCSIMINIPWGSHVLFKNYFHKSSIAYLLSIVFYISISILIAVINNQLILIISNKITHAFWMKMIICVIFPNILFFVFYCKLKVYIQAKEVIVSFFLNKNNT